MSLSAIILSLASLASCVSAYPSTQGGTEEFPPYIAPGPGDVRSPCPGLNSLANHGFIPRSGKGNTLPILIQGLADGLSIGQDFTIAIGGAGLLSNPNQDVLNPFFDLDHLQLHNFPIEHDASLSRGEKFFGNNLDFNQTLWDSVVAFITDNSDFEIENSAMGRYHRVQTESARNPTFTYMPQHFLFSYGETALYLSTMGSSPFATSAPRGYVQSLFEEERLPYELGWTKSPLPITLPSLAVMVKQLFTATGEQLPEGLLITETTLRAAWSGFDPISRLPL